MLHATKHGLCCFALALLRLLGSAIRKKERRWALVLRSFWRAANSLQKKPPANAGHIPLALVALRKRRPYTAGAEGARLPLLWLRAYASAVM